MRALYCYFGRMDDHNLDIPGHPLYQTFFLKALSKKFNVDKFDIFYYNELNEVKNDFSILKKSRENFFNNKVRYNGMTLNKVLNNKYDIVFMKYRFRNYSRLVNHSLDAYYFDLLYRKFKDKVYIIDTDAEVRGFYDNIITFFKNEYIYECNNIISMVPILKSDILNNTTIKIRRNNNFMFIGNEYFKRDLPVILEQLHKLNNKMDITVQGKWKSYDYLNVLDRTKRIEGYTLLENSIASIHYSKQVYHEYEFMSPRIFESFLLGTIIFSNDRFMPEFCRYASLIELSEKLKFLNECNSEQYYNIWRKCIDELYNNIGDV